MSRLSKLGFINTQRTRGPVRSRIRSRGVPTPLQNYEVLVTEDVDETMEMLGAFLGPTKLVVQGEPDEFVATFHALRLRDVTLAYLDFQTAVELNIEHTRDLYAVHMPMNGQATVRYSDGRDIVATTLSAAVVNPGDEVTMNWAFDSPQLIVRIEARAVKRQLARLLGHRGAGDVVFAPEFELTPDALLHERQRRHGLGGGTRHLHAAVGPGLQRPRAALREPAAPDPSFRAGGDELHCRESREPDLPGGHRASRPRERPVNAAGVPQRPRYDAHGILA